MFYFLLHNFYTFLYRTETETKSNRHKMCSPTTRGEVIQNERLIEEASIGGGRKGGGSGGDDEDGGGDALLLFTG